MYEQCVVCGRYLNPENEFVEQDDCYEINEEIVCDDCILDYVRNNCYKKLKEE